MSKGINKVILIGNLGADPESRMLPSGSVATNLRLATSESWNDRETGERKERTEWHRVAMFGKRAEVAAQYLRKGSKVYIEGKLRTREYEKDGEKRYATEIVADEMQMLDGRGEQTAAQGHNYEREQRADAGAPPKNELEFDDEVPF